MTTLPRFTRKNTKVKIHSKDNSNVYRASNLMTHTQQSASNESKSAALRIQTAKREILTPKSVKGLTRKNCSAVHHQQRASNSFALSRLDDLSSPSDWKATIS
jgi:hypothetical protein